jgi:hypothetical protein
MIHNLSRSFTKGNIYFIFIKHDCEKSEIKLFFNMGVD